MHTNVVQEPGCMVVWKVVIFRTEDTHKTEENTYGREDSISHLGVGNT